MAMAYDIAHPARSIVAAMRAGVTLFAVEAEDELEQRAEMPKAELATPRPSPRVSPPPAYPQWRLQLLPCRRMRGPGLRII